MLFKELDEQIEKIRQRVEDLSGKRKELCRRSFIIQSEEIQNDIIELRKELVKKKNEILQQVKDLSGKRNEFCRRSFIIQSKEIKNDIIELCQNWDNKKVVVCQLFKCLFGKVKELCCRSSSIQSEEIKNGIIELSKKLVDIKKEIKKKEIEVNRLEKDLNALVLSDSKLYKKSYLENLYFFSAIVIGSIPINVFVWTATSLHIFT